jgi:hypothetical protein
MREGGSTASRIGGGEEGEEFGSWSASQPALASASLSKVIRAKSEFIAAVL